MFSTRVRERPLLSSSDIHRRGYERPALVGSRRNPGVGDYGLSRQQCRRSAVDCCILLAVIGSSKRLAKIRRTTWGA